MNNTDIIEDFAKKEIQKYYREWRKNNKDKVKEYNKTYWKKRAMKNIDDK